MISGANEEQLELANARADILLLQQENQSLKKQLEEINKFKFSYRKDETKIPPIIRKQKDVEIIKEKENQQKDFIKYLEDEFTKIQNDIEKEIDNNVKYFKVERRQAIAKILQKYKEIIGGKE